MVNLHFSLPKRKRFITKFAFSPKAFRYTFAVRMRHGKGKGKKKRFRFQMKTHFDSNFNYCNYSNYTGAQQIIFFLCRGGRDVIKILQLHHPDRLCESEACSFSCAISDLGSKCSYLDITYLLISIKMRMASILNLNTLTMLTIGHTDRGRPTLKRWRCRFIIINTIIQF